MGLFVSIVFGFPDLEGGRRREREEGGGKDRSGWAEGEAKGMMRKGGGGGELFGGRHLGLLRKGISFLMGSEVSQKNAVFLCFHMVCSCCRIFYLRSMLDVYL